MYYVENIIHEVYLVDPKNICHLLPADSPSLTRVSILKKSSVNFLGLDPENCQEIN